MCPVFVVYCLGALCEKYIFKKKKDGIGLHDTKDTTGMLTYNWNKQNIVLQPVTIENMGDKNYEQLPRNDGEKGPMDAAWKSGIR